MNREDNSMTVWFAINKNGKVRMFINEPARNTELGIWDGDMFCNSLIQKQLESMVKGTTLSWDSDAQAIQLS